MGERSEQEAARESSKLLELLRCRTTALRWVTLDELAVLSDEPNLLLLAQRGLAVAREVAKFPH